MSPTPYSGGVEGLASVSPEIRAEALALARYLLPDARTLIATDAGLATRIADDYARALRHHHRPPLGLGGARALGDITLRAWEGLFAPRTRRAEVRQHLLLMSAILESQPSLAVHFLPANYRRIEAVWRLAQMALAMAAAAVLSIGLQAGRRMRRGG